MKLSMLTALGIEDFRQGLAYVRANGQPHVDFCRALDGEELSEVIGRKITVPDNPAPFETRYDLARFLSRTLAEHDGDVMYESGFWSWIALKYFDKVATGRRLKPGADARWIAETESYQRYYRHLFAGPFYAYQAHRDEPTRALAVLATSPDKPGEVVEQLASRQEVIVSRGGLGAATLLYYDPDTSKLRRGASSKGKGSARRYVDYLSQLDLTYDIHEMPPFEVVRHLPSEYTKFKEPFWELRQRVLDLVEREAPVGLKELRSSASLPAFHLAEILRMLDADGRILFDETTIDLR